MYGPGHLIALLIMVAFVPLMAWQKGAVIALRRSRRFMVGFSVVILTVELITYVAKFIYKYEPFYERLPFHLCAGLSLLLPILVLLERYDVIKFVALWSVAAGLISLLNLGVTHNSMSTLAFYHYFLRHYYLFLFPIFLFIAGEYEFQYRYALMSMGALLVVTAVIFFVDWAFNANFFYIGKDNDMAVPFLPDRLMEWPFVFPSFVGVGLIMLHGIFGSFALAQRRRTRRE
jgi:hypothetical integral membrane protein (TIGR02206 family)